MKTDINKRERNEPIVVRVTDELLDSETALKRALVSLERANMAREAHYAWNSITACNRHMAQYLTSAFPSVAGGALLTKALGSAFSAYARAEPGERVGPLRAYFESVLATLEEVFAFRVFSRNAQGKTRRWIALSTPLVSFISETRAVELLWFYDATKTDLNRDLKRGMIAACVLNYEDLLLLERPVGNDTYASAALVRSVSD